MIIRLTDWEVRVCKAVGTERNEVCSKYPKNPDKPIIGNQDPLQSNIEGFVGEFVFGKAMNTFVDFDTSPKHDVPDGITNSGLRYDVKSTPHRNGRLVVSEFQINPNVDFYALVRLIEDFRLVEITGYAWKDEAITEENRNKYQKRPGFWMHPEELHEFETKEGRIYEPTKMQKLQQGNLFSAHK